MNPEEAHQVLGTGPSRPCNSLEIKLRDHADALAETLPAALADRRAAAIAAMNAVCLEIAEDEAERCRDVSATTAQQTARPVAVAFGGGRCSFEARLVAAARSLQWGRNRQVHGRAS